MKTAGAPKPPQKSKKPKKSEGTAPEVINITKPEGDEAKLQLKYGKDPQLRDSILSGEILPVVELGKIDSAEGEKDMPPPDAPGSCIPTFAPDEETRAATETLKALQGYQGTAGLPENLSLLTPPGEAEYFEHRGLMETVRQSHKRHQKIHCAPVTQQSVPDTPVNSITTISVRIIPPARVVADDLTKANLREGLPNILLMLQVVWVDKLPVNQQILTVQVVLVELRTISHHLLSQEHLSCTQVDLAPVVLQQVAVVGIPMSQDRMFPIKPCTSQVKMSLLTIHTRLYLSKMPLPFPTFQDKVLKGLTVVTSYQLRLLDFEEPTIMNQVM